MGRSIPQGWPTLVDEQVKRGKSLTSGGRRQFAALYPNVILPSRLRFAVYELLHRNRRRALAARAWRLLKFEVLHGRSARAPRAYRRGSSHAQAASRGIGGA